MTNDEIEKEAKEVYNLIINMRKDGKEKVYLVIAAFAKKIRKDVLEDACKWVMTTNYATGHADTIEELMEYLVKQVRKDTIEGCARVADRCEAGNGDIADEIAWSIRVLEVKS